jgi:hypothetical protein
LQGKKFESPIEEVHEELLLHSVETNPQYDIEFQLDLAIINEKSRLILTMERISQS